MFFDFSLTSNQLHPLQVENCDSNSRLVVDEDDNGKFRLERVKGTTIQSPGGRGEWSIFKVNIFRLIFCEINNCLKDIL